MLDVCQLLCDPINNKTFSKKTDIRAQESIFCIFRIKIKCCTLHIFNLQDQIPSPEVEKIMLSSNFQISKSGYSKIEFWKLFIFLPIQENTRCAPRLLRRLINSQQSLETKCYSLSDPMFLLFGVFPYIQLHVHLHKQLKLIDETETWSN